MTENTFVWRVCKIHKNCFELIAVDDYMKRYEQLAEDLINAIPQETTLYCKRRKGLILIVEREKKK